MKREPVCAMVLHNVRRLEASKTGEIVHPVLIGIHNSELGEHMVTMPDGNAAPRIVLSFATDLGKVSFVYDAYNWRQFMSAVEQSSEFALLEQGN